MEVGCQGIQEAYAAHQRFLRGGGKEYGRPYGIQKRKFARLSQLDCL